MVVVLVALVPLVALVVVGLVVQVVLAVLLSVLLVSRASLVVGVAVSVLRGLFVVRAPWLTLWLLVAHSGWSGLRLWLLGKPVKARL